MKMKTRLTAGLAVLGMSLGGLLIPATSNAQSYLVGAYLFGANSTGTTTNLNYQYDTNTNSGDLPLVVNGVGKNFSQLLTTGVNNFTFSFGTQAFPLNGFGDLGLYFSSSPAAFNPAIAAPAPNLLVSGATGSGTFFVPLAGTVLNNYHYTGSASANATGASTFSVGGNTLSVTSYSVTSTPTGTFTLNVTPATAPVSTPEPGTVGLLASLGTIGVFAVRRRRVLRK